MIVDEGNCKDGGKGRIGMSYRLLEWNKETQTTKLLRESDQYEEIWDGWVEQPKNRIISFKIETGSKRDGK